MNLKNKLYFILFVLLLLSVGHVQAQVTSDPYSFNLSEGHELTAVVTSRLVWQDDQNELVRINFTMSDFIDNESSIDISVVQIFTVESGSAGIPQLGATNASGFTLTTDEPSTYIEESVAPPDGADRFYLNVSITASPAGGGVESISDNYFLRFPQDDTIIIEQENIVPVVNLYGFPQLSFFELWLPVYGISIFFLLLPGISFGIMKLREVREDKTEPQVEDEVSEPEEKEAEDELEMEDDNNE